MAGKFPKLMLDTHLQGNRENAKQNKLKQSKQTTPLMEYHIQTAENQSQKDNPDDDWEKKDMPH